ncbi:MAG TPA: alanine dehydrogenase [Syntrophales bacterium]|nr:alanine dehydrogenase [Syntrophales bacterium]HPI55801.1 alanine dehydrogenase [Syntrophales bacterium]HPN23707.1 alanine dehydrogenase [Syntrophales bacterium]HQM27767.1 alanine dehydrogenase [Syntrophales bacterium]
MRIGLPREIKDNEYRVAMTPGGVRQLVEYGHGVVVQSGAGLGSGFSDDQYRSAGAEIVQTADEAWKTELVVKVKEPQPQEYGFLHSALILFTYLHLAAEKNLTLEMMKRGSTGIAYETVEQPNGQLPLLKPMSEVAGRLAVQIGAHYLERVNGGAGKLMGGVPGVEPAAVAIIGAGTVAANAARIALGMEAEVVVLDVNIDRLVHLEETLEGRLKTLSSNPLNIAEAVSQADLLIGAVLLKGARTPRLVTRPMIKSMKPGSVVIDVSVDQGGCVETIRPTTHSNPVYLVDGIIHYGVTNMPGAVPRTSTYALSNATLPYIVRLANGGLRKAVQEDHALAMGVNIHAGKITYGAVADAFDFPFTPLDSLI